MREGRILTLAVFFVWFSALFLSYANAEETTGGNIKERIRERVRQRLSERSKDETVFGPGDYKFSVNLAGINRFYRIHVPPSYKKSVSAPLILAFHGGGGDSEIMAKDEYYNLISKSDKEGFIVAFPNGVSKLPSGKLATWNAGNCCGYARDTDAGDVGFIKYVIGDIKSKLNISVKRVYAIGMSNGGMFSYRLACQMPGEFRAIASVAGTDNYDDCNPAVPISIMHIHALNDGHVLFNGGAGPGAFRDMSQVTDFTSVPETVSRWVKRDRCQSGPERVMEGPGVYCDLYSDCDGNVQVKLCVTEDGGHSWPGAKKKPREKADTPSQAMSATDEIWEFFNNQP